MLNGIEISRIFYNKCVFPLLSTEFGWFKDYHSACLIGCGSEVLEMSRDHDFGPRVFLFITKENHSKFFKKMDIFLSKNLPNKCCGMGTHFKKNNDDTFSCLFQPKKKFINHKVKILVLSEFLQDYISISSYEKVDQIEWLSVPQQRLLSLVSGEVFFDGLGILAKMRKTLNYYPEDVWLYILAVQWQKISEEQAFVGRAGDLGDEIGSRIIASKICTYIMELVFLYEKTYIPYSKWFGSGFKKLENSKELIPILNNSLVSKNWKDREGFLVKAYEILTKIHNKKFLVKIKLSKSFFGRPFIVSCSEEIVKNIFDILKKKKTEFFENLDRVRRIGSIDQVFHCHTQCLENSRMFKSFRDLFN